MPQKRDRVEEPRPTDEGPGVGLIGAAEGAPLSQGRDGSFPVEFDGVDITVREAPERIRGEPVEPTLHAPTTDHVEPRPIATGECTVEVLAGAPACGEEEG